MNDIPSQEENMKKSLSVLLALLMLLPTFTACAESGTNEETTAPASSDVAPEVVEEAAPVAEEADFAE